jgi:hypothetical protein
MCKEIPEAFGLREIFTIVETLFLLSPVLLSHNRTRIGGVEVLSEGEVLCVCSVIQRIRGQ